MHGLERGVAAHLHDRLTADRARIALRLVAADQTVRDVSAGELADRAKSYAVWFSARSAKGDVVGICLYHGFELYAAFIGALWSGAIPTMVAPPSPRIEKDKYVRSFKHICEYIRPVVLVVDPEAVSALAEIAAGAEATFGSAVPADVPAGGEYEVSLSSAPEDVILVQHSSGTTGLQKGVALSNRAVLAHNRAYRSALEMTSEDVIVSWLPLYHDMGFIACFMLPLLEGIEVVAMSPFDWVRKPLMLLEQIDRYRGTLCWLPNFAFAVLANARERAAGEKPLDLSCVRAWINSSEPVSAAATSAFVSKFSTIGVSAEQLTASYAMAENVYAVTQTKPGALRTIRVDAKELRDHHRVGLVMHAESTDAGVSLVSNGYAVTGTEVRVLTAQQEVAPDGDVGEIAIKGEYLFSGYFRKPESTAAVMTPDGWYRTGDLGFLFDGELYITGRLKDLIIVQGRNFYPADIERAAEIGGVLPGRVVAFGLPDLRTGTEGVAILAELDEASDDRHHAIVGDIRRTIAQEFDCTPTVVRIVPRRWLVKASSGKLARTDNRTKYLAEFVASTPAPLPASRV